MTAISLETLRLLGIKINKNQLLKLKNIIIIKSYFKRTSHQHVFSDFLDFSDILIFKRVISM
jgi:hypothetical protein